MSRQSLSRIGLCLAEAGLLCVVRLSRNAGRNARRHTSFSLPVLLRTGVFPKGAPKCLPGGAFSLRRGSGVTMRKDAVRSFARENDFARGHNQGRRYERPGGNESGGRSFASKTLCPGENAGTLP